MQCAYKIVGMASHEISRPPYSSSKRGLSAALRTTALLAGAVLSAVVLQGYSQTTVSAASAAPLAQAPAQPPAVPYTKKHIYDETTDPKADIAAALKQAKHEHKNVILDFGGDWCGDCQVLDIYFHQSPNDALLAKNFVLVHIFIGHMDKNVDVAEKYGIPLNKGVPALAVVNPAGKVLYSQKTGEFENMRHMDAQSVTEFLDRWKS
jgi:thiol:disulfide interchange protein